MKYQLGVSIKSIVNPLTKEALACLEGSQFATFETNLANFCAPSCDDNLVELFIQIKKRTGKTSPSCHCPYGKDRDLSALDEKVRLGAVSGLVDLFPMAHSLGAELLVEHPSWEPVSDAERPARLAQLRRSLAELDPLLKAEKFRMALELLPRTCIGNTGEELMAIVDGFDDTFGICVDVNHMMSRIDCLADTIRLVGKRLFSLHISDYHGVDEEHLLPGTGKIDWAAFMQALNDVNYRGIFNYEVRLHGSTSERISLVEHNFETLFVPLMKA